MKTKRTKEEQFVIELCHAFAKYGIKHWSFEDERVSSRFLRLRMNDAIDDNWDDIFKTSYYLEQVYND